MYYLQSRYYNPEFGRFINADSIGGEKGKLLSHNLFAYCLNNPVNMADDTGHFAWWIAGAIIGGVVGGIVGAVVSYQNTGSVDWRYVAGGAVAGALVGAGLGALAQAAYTTIAATATVAAPVINTAVQKMDKVREIGRQGEKIANIVDKKDRIVSLTQTAKYRIPDALDMAGKILTEVKNVKYQGLTNQIKDFVLYSEQKGLTMNLITRTNTIISGPLQKYIDDGKIIHLFLGQ
ncbi:tRNA nuclease WapA precursor [compost metagenome]